jgi:threonine/homoserine/homoserine lactone efflux protein
MPIAGPISILITSHSLRGQLRYCFAAAIGSAVVDLVICFVAIHGTKKLIGLYAAIVPFALSAGAIFLFIVGIRIIKARFELNQKDDPKPGIKQFENLRKRSGFFTGLFLNASNPSLFFGWLTSSLIVLSFAGSIGLNVGGLDHVLSDNVASVNSYANKHNTNKEIMPSIVAPSSPIPVAVNHEKSVPESTQLLFSFCYAASVAIGTIIWFLPFSYLLYRYRNKLRIDIISNVIHGLGMLLCGFALVLAWRSLVAFNLL